jgi:hypothetical protein
MGITKRYVRILAREQAREDLKKENEILALKGGEDGTTIQQ